jgi:hypothetical protein
MYKLIIILSLSFIPVCLLGQKKDDTPQDMQIKGVVIAGLNMSQIDGDEVYGYYKFGLNTGVGAILPLGKNFSLSLETLYNQKGSYKKFPPEPDGLPYPYYKLKVDYVDVPFMLYYEDRHVWTFGLGFSWGRRVNYKETIHGRDTTFGQWVSNGSLVYVQPGHIPGSDTVITHYPFSKNDLDVIVDIHFRIWQHLKMDVRYAYSIASLGTRHYFQKETGASWSRKMYDNIITLRLMYILNERYVPPPKPKKEKKKKTTAYVAQWN